jgi:hypothetical protein
MVLFGGWDMWWSGSASNDYSSIIAGAVSKLPTNNIEARQELYNHARAALARQLEQDPAGIKRERRALEKAIRQVERDKPAYTALLIASIFFLGQLWLLEYTSNYVPSPMLLRAPSNNGARDTSSSA